MTKKCGQCEHFIGMGDWDLCCGKQVRRLCYEMDEACKGFEQAKTCRNVSATVGVFFCSICGEHGWDSVFEDMRCVNCGNEIVGAIFKGQLGWRDDE